ncbi:MAG: efflux RND transporter permease subunit, partial [Planctomycetota bacterium]
VWVEFEWGTDIYRARQTVTERLQTATGNLPREVKPPVLAPVSSIMGEILFASLTSDRHSQLELRSVAKTEIRRRVLSVAGVSQVTAIGGDEKQYQVVLSPERLRAYGIGPDEVAEALRRSNENVSAGFLIEGSQESIIQGVGRIRTPEDIGNTVVALRGETPVRVSDLGVVGIGAAIKRGTGSASRRGPNWEPITEPGVIIAIQKQPGANTLELTRRLDAVLDEIQTTLPEGMFINKNLFRQANFIENSVHNTVLALRDGGIMVIIVVLFFLANVRAGVITILAIPISLVTTILTLKAFGASINTMTLGGMAIAIGALVDDAIVNVENVVRRLRHNASEPEGKARPALEVIYKASVEVRASIVFATLIILLVFAPIFFLSGLEGRLLRPLGIAFSVSLAASLITALTLTPALCYYLLARNRAAAGTHEPWVVRVLKRMYAGSLNTAMRHPWWVILPTFGLLVAALVGASRMGRAFLPEFNEGALVVGLVSVPGISLAESDKLAHIV